MEEKKIDGNGNCRRRRYHLFTVEVNPVFADTARQLLTLADLNEFVTVVVVNETTSVVEELCRRYREVTNVPFLFLDHDKECYLRDLIEFERSGLLRVGSMVVADNVIFCEIRDYVEYVRGLEEKGIVSTRTLECKVEYADGEEDDEMISDGIEITTYVNASNFHSD
mmetsp:Transcript_22714/g.27998  ORF Transcript_22714/g.27998 Transcript_22714/m.27998 type:complete len:167 (-) Transcript_22714:57-557(-)